MLVFNCWIEENPLQIVVLHLCIVVSMCRMNKWIISIFVEILDFWQGKRVKLSFCCAKSIILCYIFCLKIPLPLCKWLKYTPLPLEISYVDVQSHVTLIFCWGGYHVTCHLSPNPFYPLPSTSSTTEEIKKKHAKRPTKEKKNTQRGQPNTILRFKMQTNILLQLYSASF